MKNCRACGKDNRDSANFCAGCGSPLPKQGAAPAKKTNDAHRKAVIRFWSYFAAAAVLIGAAGMAAAGYFRKIEKAETVKKYTEAYRGSDEAVFGTVTDNVFSIMGLGWGMSAPQIRLFYPYAADSSDPDFVSAVAVNQAEFKIKLPHANFMSLGIKDGRLYAVKFEFGATPEFHSQALKIPNKDEIMYGRFSGLLSVFNRLYGRPLFTKDDLKNSAAEDRIKHVRAGGVKGKPSNIYYYWEKGATRIELVLFGAGGKLYLTVRFLNIPVWDAKAK